MRLKDGILVILLACMLPACKKPYKIEGKWYCTRIYSTNEKTFRQTKTREVKNLPDSVFFLGNQYIEFYSTPKFDVDTSALEIKGNRIKIGDFKLTIQNYTDTSFTLHNKTASKSWGFTVYSETWMDFKKHR
jgi:hypothetical protein